MNDDDSDFDNEDASDSYVLNPQDEQLLTAAQSLLAKVARAPSLHPAQLVSVAKLQHALARLPHANSNLEVHVSVVGPRHTFEDIETYHYWDVTLECGSLRLASGGHFYRPSSGGDSFTTMTWEAQPGGESDFSDYSASHWMVPDLRTYADGVANVDFATDGYSIEVTDSDNPLLDEMGDEEEDEGDEEGDGEESAREKVEFSVSPTFESLWDHCIANGRAIPRDWHKLYEMLANKRQKPSGGWTPSLPMILAAWDVTTPIEKQLRFKEHIQWAHEHDQLDEIGRYLRSLPEDRWYHFGEF